jgi:hypothetical protein
MQAMIRRKMGGPARLAGAPARANLFLLLLVAVLAFLLGHFT